ncbi:MAG: K(+)-transporting ATPase subunit F [Phycisphaerales bacterium]|jgi:K+-transporting ATPase KdpF subunit
MTHQAVIYAIAAVVAVALLLYLLVALLKPEWFQ